VIFFGRAWLFETEYNFATAVGVQHHGPQRSRSISRCILPVVGFYRFKKSMINGAKSRCFWKQHLSTAIAECSCILEGSDGFEVRWAQKK
jgi:hypothetical protein